jgi:hypothetical protein
MRFLRSVMVRELVAPAALLVAMLGSVEAGLRSAPVLEWVDRHRPPYGRISMRLHVEKQLWHVEALARSEAPRVVYAGSSSVVNGIDEVIATSTMRGAGLPYDARNFGMTGVMGYELPSLAPYLLARGTVAVVYLYNGFSFGDELHPDAIETRWDTAEMVRLLPPDPLDTTRLAELVDRTFAQHLWLLRYRNLLIDIGSRWLSGRLAPLPSPFDYDPGREVARDRPRTLAPPVGEGDWVRRAYLQSGQRESSLGLRGLRRFCDLSQAHGIPLIVSAAPEPIFGRYEGYARDVDYAAIDRRVQAIAGACGARYLPRHDDLENRDEWFVDAVHLGADGRALFSSLIARETAALLR